MESLFRCPVCGAPLDRGDRAYRCPAGHSYDIAREGYTYLLPPNQKHSADPGDDRDMAAARRDFLSKGYYDPLLNTLCCQILSLSGESPVIWDVGCGEGQATVFFARNGYTVSAFDVTASGIEKGRQLAELHRTEVDFFQADLLNYQPESTFDIVFSSGVLQYIPRAERRRVLEGYKAHTAVGGIHVLNVFVDKPFLPVPPDWEEGEDFWSS